jgi:hypothetical protein
MRFPHCARLPESSHAFTTLSSSFKKQKHFTSAFTVFLLMTVAGSFTNSLPAQESAPTTKLVSTREPVIMYTVQSPSLLADMSRA